MNRREFLGVGALAASSTVVGRNSLSAREGSVKFCVFADIHFRPGRFPNSTKEWLGRILERAKREKCDFVIHCGDMCHNPPAVKDYIDYYNKFELPTYHVLGNHETDGCSYEDVLKTYRMDKGHYFFDCNGFRFIVVDTNYFYRKSIKGFVHFGKEARKSGDVWGCVSNDQYEWIERVINDSPYPCAIFSHLSFERSHGDRRMQEIFARANAKTPGKVRIALNGHYHCDFLRVFDDVIYFDVNSASYQWIGGKRAHKYYPESYFKRVGLSGTTSSVPWISYDDPLSAIVSMSKDGCIRIDGMKSTFACGITPKKVKMEVDNHSRTTTSCIQSVNLKFTYS